MARLSGQEAADKWGRRLKAATPDIQAGIKRVTTAPGVKAAAQAQVMAANLAARIADGTWQKRVAGVSLNDWQNAALNKGVGRIAAGVDNSAQKAADAFTKVLAAVDGALGVVNQTPRGDLETNIGRANTFMREMAARAPTRKG